MLQIKPVNKEQLILSIDRLTRFKDPETKYLRVFKDLISNNLIEPKYKKSDIDNFDYDYIKELGQEIINFSINILNKNNSATSDFSVNQKLFEYENSVFNISENTKKLLKKKNKMKNTW